MPNRIASSTTANNSPPADGVNVSPRRGGDREQQHRQRGKIHADRGIGPCALMLITSSNPAAHDDATNPSSHQPFAASDELPRGFDRAEIVQIVVTAARETDELLRFVRQRKQAARRSAIGIAGSRAPCMTSSGALTRAMRWSERNWIAHHQTHRHKLRNADAATSGDRRVAALPGSACRSGCSAASATATPVPSEKPQTTMLSALYRAVVKRIGRRGILQQSALSLGCPLEPA